MPNAVEVKNGTQLWDGMCLLSLCNYSTVVTLLFLLFSRGPCSLSHTWPCTLTLFFPWPDLSMPNTGDWKTPILLQPTLVIVPL